MKLLAATTNRGKIVEIAEILSGLGVTVVTPEEIDLHIDVKEDGATFAENALIKARAWSEAAGMPALADDSGLCVDALDGRPGVMSARFSGPDATDEKNIELLLRSLQSKTQRTARFVCAVALAWQTGEVILAEGRYEGIIIDEPRGRGGFGYDPVFLDPELNKTLAQMSPGEKNARSHRRKALDALKTRLQESGLLHD
ncbi:MAG TPA: RdgB/HAM1 family non-canonical purine NTP pyrophosphatase [Deltaproteobacteria bacterium]|jgi:XTP/dITP diphosphohydrolase|nr:RdgB/HAM1 family non-canonical purine NTP pyrophosphatase [Bacteriovoracaceae bacterium]HNU74704.1 RdgB/HAM1 family non-canonical purine NTP pyrophosphatase [Deltaproteobacteria bacterium]HRR20433.1 RdgB/HAM1 family non-canonical purine NTP pyrophosphatase [Desulfomonilia bacterium]HOD72124.1 RdgB/HAM1 family non-canonical purine NTP pyrophosphatase [Deltaproteobacteria bacterium]HOE72483.1 RdgB/HAM1 family non-canonical purine NTP pyrophosphatase [Deltaproteobacteria bacterium]